MTALEAALKVLQDEGKPLHYRIQGNHGEETFICLERALDTTTKWNLKHTLGPKLVAF